MKKLSLVLAVAMLLTGCTQGQTESQSAASGVDSAAAGADAVVEAGASTQRISVEEVPLYQQIPLGDDEVMGILDIDEHSVLFAVHDSRQILTDRIQIFDMDTGQIVMTEQLSDVYVFYGTLVGDGYVYSAVQTDDSATAEQSSLERERGYVRRVGTHAWEYELTAPMADGDAAPMPFVLPDESVAFVDCGGVYYELEPGMSRMSVVVVSPDGTANTLFTPSEDQFMAHSRLIAYGDGYLLRLRTSAGFAFYAGDKDHVERVMVLEGCRAVYSWWVPAGDKFLFLLGYGSDEAGIAEIKTVVTTADGTVVTTDDTAYSKLTSDGKDHVAAVGPDSIPYVLTMEHEAISATRIDLPAGRTEFYCDGAGTLYAHFTDSNAGKVGLYKIMI